MLSSAYTKAVRYRSYSYSSRDGIAASRIKAMINISFSGFSLGKLYNDSKNIDFVSFIILILP